MMPCEWPQSWANCLELLYNWYVKSIQLIYLCVCALQFCCFTPSTSVISVAQPIRVEISHKVDLNKQLFQVSIIDLEKKNVKYKSQS